MRFLIAAALAATTAMPALAAETEGLVLAYDRRDHVLVMDDMTVWYLPPSLMVPADLGKGDRVYIDFVMDGDNGVVAVNALERLAPALSEDNDGGS